MYDNFSRNKLMYNGCTKLSSPVQNSLVPKPQLSPKTQLVPRRLGLTLKSCRPPTQPNLPPFTFKQKEGFPPKSQKVRMS